MTIEQIQTKIKDKNFYETLKFIKEYKKPIPKTPLRPRLKTDHTVDEAKQYIIDLENFISLDNSINKVRKQFIEFNIALDELIEKKLKDDVGLFSIPEQYQSKVWTLAWEHGHSYGYNEVYGKLLDLVYIFEY